MNVLRKVVDHMRAGEGGESNESRESPVEASCGRQFRANNTVYIIEIGRSPFANIT